MNLLATALAACTATAVISAQGTPADPAVRTETKKAPFVFEAGQVELRALIERCGAYLQRNILVDDVELMAAFQPPVRGRRRGQGGAAPAAGAAQAAGPSITLQLPVVTDHDGCEELLSSLLWRRGLAIVPLDEAKGVYEILAMHGQRGREVATRAVQRTPEQVLARPMLRHYVTVVYELKHTQATIASNALRPFYATTGGQGPGTMTLGNVGNSTAILMTGPNDVVASALLVIRAADRRSPDDAPDLRKQLEDLAKQNQQLQQRIATIERRLAKR